MRPQTCCCHVCKTSLNQYKREFIPCSKCNKIVCRNCFGTKHRVETWEDAISNRHSWHCPSCTGTCLCPRCRKKPSNQLAIEGEIFKTQRDVEQNYSFSELLITSYSSGPNSLNASSATVTSTKTNNLTSSSFQSQLTSSETNSVSSEDTFIFPKMILAKVFQQSGASLAQKQKMITKKLKPQVQKVFQTQLEELSEREKRCSSNIAEMERLLLVMKREREEVNSERARVENMLFSEQQQEEKEEQLEQMCSSGSVLNEGNDSPFLSAENASSPESALEEITV